MKKIAKKHRELVICGGLYLMVLLIWLILVDSAQGEMLWTSSEFLF